MADPIVGSESTRCVHWVCVLSVHTSPLELPGTGSADGMNVYIVETATRWRGDLDDARHVPPAARWRSTAAHVRTAGIREHRTARSTA